MDNFPDESFCPHKNPGLEVFAGTARLTASRVKRGIPMHYASELQKGPEFDVFNPRLDELIKSKKVGWLWLAPPCKSFSPLRNLDRNGPLRPKDAPEGDPGNPEVKLGN